MTKLTVNLTESKVNVTHKRGNFYTDGVTIYQIVQFADSKVSLICLTNGNRQIDDGNYVKDVHNITQMEFDNMGGKGMTYIKELTISVP